MGRFIFMTWGRGFFMTHSILKGALVSAVLMGTSFPAMARDLGDDYWSADRFQIRARMLGLVPDEDADVSIGGEAHVGNSLTPELDLTYFITDHIGVEAIAATAQHKLTHTPGGDLGNTWILPPTVTLQYHFTPDNAFSPYVGAGVNYSYFYGEEEGTGFNDLEVEGRGHQLRGSARAPARRIRDAQPQAVLQIERHLHEAPVHAGTTPVHADVDLDPWVLGAGVSFRF